MSKQPEALQIADALEKHGWIAATPQWCIDAAAELRRLHALNQEWERKAATWLASPEAAKRLEGYRELAQQTAQALNQSDELLVTLQRRSGVIRILEQDVHAHQQRANNAIGTRKVLWDLLGECLPLLEYDAQETHCGPSHDAIVALIQRINDARTAVQAEELSDRSDHHGADWTDREQEYLK